MNKAEVIKNLLAERQILSVYSGRPGCACGCRGEHRETKAAITRAVSDLGKLASLEQVEVDLEPFGSHSALLYWENETGTRCRIIYFAK